MAFPMITANNISTTNTIKKDLKKKTVELITRYNQVGIIEDEVEDSEEKYSLYNKVRTVSRESSRKKIQIIRQHSG